MLRSFSAPRPLSYPSGRYTASDPLRRLFGLRLLSETWPDALKTSLLRAWLHPMRYNGNQAIQSRQRQRPDDAELLASPLSTLEWLAWMELAISRRVVETARTAITREERNALLRSQGVYLEKIYRALAARVGAPAAQAIFQRLFPRAA